MWSIANGGRSSGSHVELSFRRRRHPTRCFAPKPCAPTEKSTRPRRWPVVRPAPALSGRIATASPARAAASCHAGAETGFLGPATRVASSKCSVAGPRNDTSVSILPNVRSASLDGKLVRQHRRLSFRRRRHPHAALPRNPRAPTEKSTRPRRRPVVRPAPALSGRIVTASPARAAASCHAVAEIGFLGPATRVASSKCSVAGPRNDTSVSTLPNVRSASLDGKLVRQHRRLSFRRRRHPTLAVPQTRAPTEKSTRPRRRPVVRPAPALSGRTMTASPARAAASGHAVAESRFLGPATRVASRKCSAAGPRNDTSVFIRRVSASSPEVCPASMPFTGIRTAGERRRRPRRPTRSARTGRSSATPAGAGKRRGHVGSARTERRSRPG
jgi:hypothetical protein